jgi:hypothetical protein
MTGKTRLLLARFFRIHPGYLVDDPEEFSRQVITPIPEPPASFVAWLRAGAARFRHDALVAETLRRLAGYPERRKALRLLNELLALPALMDRLLHTLESKKG